MDAEQDFSELIIGSNENQPPTLTKSDLVAKVLQFAKLDLQHVDPNVQQMYFARSLQQDDEIRLLELNQCIENHLDNGGKLILKGNTTDNCVICTDSQTFEVKDTEISNSLMLVKGIQLDKTNNTFEGKINLSDITVGSISHSYLELRSVRPKTNVLLSLLEPSIYDGPEKEDDAIQKTTLATILAVTSASDREIERALSSLHAIELNGFVRLISFDYMSRVIGSVADLLEENSWKFEDFSRTTTLNTLSELYPSEIVQHVLEFYGSSTQSSSDTKTDAWCLKEDEVSSC